MEALEKILWKAAYFQKVKLKLILLSLINNVQFTETRLLCTLTYLFILEALSHNVSFVDATTNDHNLSGLK